MNDAERKMVEDSRKRAEVVRTYLDEVEATAPTTNTPSDGAP